MISLLAAGLVSCAGYSPEESAEPFQAAAPDVQDVTVEHENAVRQGTIALCESPGAFIPFERPIERQVYDVVTAYKTGLTETLERLVAKTIVAEAERYGLDPWLVVGVIRVESRFNNFALSNKDARGLMQVLPDTGAELAEDLGVAWTGGESLYNPIKNVKLGTAYLAQLNRKFGGDWDTTLAAYNMGPGRVRQWLADGRDLPTGYASLCQDYQKLLKNVARRSEGGADLRSPITSVERMMARRHSIVVLPVVADVDPSQDGVASGTSVPGILAEPAIDTTMVEEPDQPVSPWVEVTDENDDGGLSQALEESVEPAIIPAAE